ncbi:ctr copper transporter family protein [Diplodia corticola]|uniref:Copper transport protein n=1 Tax=Diplodia corticola TaxID=236234 RepID=A0A1J9QSG1_9PEZI|nr:ctr copper transporter family protein [Diplodia corticola]OJD31392.1 ctr copper transporter family protein [Diplodia corticola]
MDMSGTSSTASSMAMAMASTATTSAAAAATSTAKMSMGGMGGGSSCKISMLWNWYTVDACFIARSWHVRSAGAFAGSCIGVILLVVSLELLRRAQRDLDRYFRRVNSSATSGTGTDTIAREEGVRAGGGGGGGVASSSASSGASSGKGFVGAGASRSGGAGGAGAGGGGGGGGIGPLRWWQQLVRSALFMVQFAVGYFVMLLAMYYNGYIIICIFIGAFLGAAMFQWDTYYSGAE